MDATSMFFLSLVLVIVLMAAAFALFSRAMTKKFASKKKGHAAGGGGHDAHGHGGHHHAPNPFFGVVMVGLAYPIAGFFVVLAQQFWCDFTHQTVDIQYMWDRWFHCPGVWVMLAALWWMYLERWDRITTVASWVLFLGALLVLPYELSGYEFLPGVYGFLTSNPVGEWLLPSAYKCAHNAACLALPVP